MSRVPTRRIMRYPFVFMLFATFAEPASAQSSLYQMTGFDLVFLASIVALAIAGYLGDKSPESTPTIAFFWIAAIGLFVSYKQDAWSFKGLAQWAGFFKNEIYAPMPFYNEAAANLPKQRQLTLTANNQASEDLLSKGVAAYQRKEFGAAHAFFRKSAELGNGMASYNLGILTLRGEGTERNPSAAMGLFSRESERGNLSARLMVAAMMFDGSGVSRNRERAAKMVAELRGESEIADSVTPMIANMCSAASSARRDLPNVLDLVKEHIPGRSGFCTLTEAGRAWDPNVDFDASKVLGCIRDLCFIEKAIEGRETDCDRFEFDLNEVSAERGELNRVALILSCS